MPYGFFTLEQWKKPSAKQKPRWVVVYHLDVSHNLSEVIAEIENRGKPGFFRITQTQRMIWAQKENGKLRLKKWHTGSAESLTRSARAFDHDKGQWQGSPKKKQARSSAR